MPDPLFCYGTLCFPEIMRRVIGVVPASLAAILMDYACYKLSGRDYPGIVPKRGMSTHGVIYQGLSRDQLERLDDYEGEEYQRQRVVVVTESGQELQAWSYVVQPGYHHLSTGLDWSLETFRREKLAQYLSQQDNDVHR